MYVISENRWRFLTKPISWRVVCCVTCDLLQIQKRSRWDSFWRGSRRGGASANIVVQAPSAENMTFWRLWGGSGMTSGKEFYVFLRTCWFFFTLHWYLTGAWGVSVDKEDPVRSIHTRVSNSTRVDERRKGSMIYSRDKSSRYEP